VALHRVLPALAAVALTLGCGGSGSNSACTPDLTVNWQIVDSSAGVARTCDEVAAGTILVDINGQSTSVPCPAGQSMGAIPLMGSRAGTYTVTVSLMHGGTPLIASAPQDVVVDCSGQSQTPVISLDVVPPCVPDLTIAWRIVSALDGSVLTCTEAGNADTVVAQIDGGGLATLTEFDGPCLGSASEDSFVAPLPASGSYNVSLQLKSGATLLSETPVLTQTVDCGGLSATPRADLLVNF
jgi:hypothetical protein